MIQLKVIPEYLKNDKDSEEWITDIKHTFIDFFLTKSIIFKTKIINLKTAYILHFLKDLWKKCLAAGNWH